jgi:hypothetical protein
VGELVDADRDESVRLEPRPGVAGVEVDAPRDVELARAGGARQREGAGGLEGRDRGGELRAGGHCGARGQGGLAAPPCTYRQNGTKRSR